MTCFYREGKVLIGFIIAIVSLVVIPEGYAEPNNLTIYILAGQSNMSGRGGIPNEIAEVIGVWNYSHAGRWSLAREPLDDPRPIRLIWSLLMRIPDWAQA